MTSKNNLEFIQKLLLADPLEDYLVDPLIDSLVLPLAEK